MSRETKKILLAILSLFVPIVGIVPYFIYTPKKDARLFGLLGLLSIIFWGLGGLNLF